MPSDAYLRNGPPDNRIYEACGKSIEALHELDGVKKVRKGEHPYVSSIILDRYGYILKDRDGEELIALTDPLTKKHAEASVIEGLLSSGDDIIRKAHTLITTLEPCSYRSTTRHPEEIACAKLITYAGIRQVIVGILDPAVTVRGRGLALLDKWGVYFGMFPSDLADMIRNKNEEYIKKHRVSWEGNLQNQERTISPYAEFELDYAPRSIRNFFEEKNVMGSLINIAMRFYQENPEYMKDEVRDDEKYYKSLSKFAEDQLQRSDNEILRDLIDKMRNERIYGTTIYQKIQQYIGYPLWGYGDEGDPEFRKDTYILFVMLRWALTGVKSRR